MMSSPSTPWTMDIQPLCNIRYPLVDPKPFCLPYRKIPPSQYQDVRKAISQMEEAGIIRSRKLLLFLKKRVL